MPPLPTFAIPSAIIPILKSCKMPTLEANVPQHSAEEFKANGNMNMNTDNAHERENSLAKTVKSPALWMLPSKCNIDRTNTSNTLSNGHLQLVDKMPIVAASTLVRSSGNSEEERLHDERQQVSRMVALVNRQRELVALTNEVEALLRRKRLESATRDLDDATAIHRKGLLQRQVLHHEELKYKETIAAKRRRPSGIRLLLRLGGDNGKPEVEVQHTPRSASSSTCSDTLPMNSSGISCAAVAAADNTITFPSVSVTDDVIVTAAATETKRDTSADWAVLRTEMLTNMARIHDLRNEVAVLSNREDPHATDDEDDGNVLARHPLDDISDGADQRQWCTSRRREKLTFIRSQGCAILSSSKSVKPDSGEELPLANFEQHKIDAAFSLRRALEEEWQLDAQSIDWRWNWLRLRQHQLDRQIVLCDKTLRSVREEKRKSSVIDDDSALKKGDAAMCTKSDVDEMTVIVAPNCDVSADAATSNEQQHCARTKPVELYYRRLRHRHFYVPRRIRSASTKNHPALAVLGSEAAEVVGIEEERVERLARRRLAALDSSFHPVLSLSSDAPSPLLLSLQSRTSTSNSVSETMDSIDDTTTLKQYRKQLQQESRLRRRGRGLTISTNCSSMHSRSTSSTPRGPLSSRKRQRTNANSNASQHRRTLSADGSTIWRSRGSDSGSNTPTPTSCKRKRAPSMLDGDALSLSLDSSRFRNQLSKYDTSFNDMVIPQSMMAHEVKMIVTKVIETPTFTVQEITPVALTALAEAFVNTNGVIVEDLSDEVFMERHIQPEIEEKRRYGSLGGAYGSREASHEEHDAKTNGSSANWPIGISDKRDAKSPGTPSTNGRRRRSIVISDSSSTNNGGRNINRCMALNLADRVSFPARQFPLGKAEQLALIDWRVEVNKHIKLQDALEALPATGLNKSRRRSGGFMSSGGSNVSTPRGGGNNGSNISTPRG